MIKEIVIAEPLLKKLKNKKTFPGEIREKFTWCVDMLLQNEHHPSLRHKKIIGTENYWEFSITMNYRCVYRKENEIAYLLEMDKHDDIF